MYERLFQGRRPRSIFPVDLDSEIRHKRQREPVTGWHYVGFGEANMSPKGYAVFDQREVVFAK